MTHDTRILILLCSLLAIPYAASASTVPAVAYPSLPNEANSASALVPEGWMLERELRGDLNKDTVPDLLLVLRMTDPANVVVDEGGSGAPQVDTNPRMLAVAFATADGRSFSTVLANHTLIPRHSDARMDDPLGDVEVINGTVRVGLGIWMSSGGWTTANRKFTFRHQEGCFKLIGYDETEVQRNAGTMSTISVNYLTSKAKISEGNLSDDAMEETWTRLPDADLSCIEAIGDGLEFSPQLNRDR